MGLFPRFLETKDSYSGLRDKMGLLKQYFESGEAKAMDEKDVLSPKYWQVNALASI